MCLPTFHRIEEYIKTFLKWNATRKHWIMIKKLCRFLSLWIWWHFRCSNDVFWMISEHYLRYRVEHLAYLFPDIASTQSFTYLVYETRRTLRPRLFERTHSPFRSKWALLHSLFSAVQKKRFRDQSMIETHDQIVFNAYIIPHMKVFVRYWERFEID